MAVLNESVKVVLGKGCSKVPSITAKIRIVTRKVITVRHGYDEVTSISYVNVNNYSTKTSI